MKKPNKPGGKMEFLPIATSALFNEPYLIRDLVETLASQRPEMGYSHEKVQLGWKAIETSTIEAHVSGQLTLSDERDQAEVSFSSGFIFTCLKENAKTTSSPGSIHFPDLDPVYRD
ncbi:MAG: hypothetical protein EOO01_02490 [Chitinophagaceae bacterium]|nr:MAG: hypothetical protein EOO01_02490 [Chitinophagaceae bacterium]